MKFYIPVFVLCCFVAQNSVAQTIHYDSVSLQHSLLFPTFAPSVQDTDFLFGNPDGNCCQLGNGGALSARFRAGSQEITMQQGSIIHIYWRIPSIIPGDSNVGIIRLQRVSDDLIPNGNDSIYHFQEPSIVNVEGMATITVPDTGRNAIGIEIAADSGGNSLFIDAVTLIQSGTAAVNPAMDRGLAVTSYPNPVEHGSIASIELSSPVSGHAELVVSDVLGQEIKRVPIGELSAGTSEIAALRLERAGVFFARLIIDGEVVGTPLKLVAE